jgi:hypothetical protein
MHICSTCLHRDAASGNTFMEAERILHRRGWRLVGKDKHKCIKCRELERRAKIEQAKELCPILND